MEDSTTVAPDGPATTTTLPATSETAVPKISPPISSNADNKETAPLEFDPSLTEDERRFYVKAYPTIDLVRERRVHCTTCKVHIGTAPMQESNIKMHPELRVTHCNKCHDFYNSGEFSKGEDGSELYCRWCGQGGEVYCCSNCAYVFCKSCIVKNLSRGVVSDIEQNENWSCFSCAPKILWPLRAQHWALINYIEKQKKNIQSMNLPDQEMRQQMSKDLSTCCRLAKAKCGNMSDSLESLDSATSRRSLNSASSAKKVPKSHGGSASQSPSAKRAKPNDEVVCTPDLMSMLEPDCQITMSPKPRSVQSPAASAPRVMSLQTGGYPQSSTPKSSAPPPLVLRNTGIQMRPVAPIVRRTVVGPRPTPNSGNGSPAAPVYHTINGYRIDLNSAAQQETFRLPNGKLIQVKRQGTQNPPPGSPATANNWQQQRQLAPSMHSRPAQIAQSTSKHYQAHITLQPQSSSGHHLPQQHPQMIRYHNTMVGNTTVTPLNHNGGGAQIHVINGGSAQNPNPPMQQQQQQQAQLGGATVRPVMVRHVFPETAIGQARTQLQDQVFNAMEICQHLTGKVQTLTNSNAYKQARNYLEVKELYIHLSYLLTYAIGRFKGLQDKCLGDMRQLGFVNDADSLENGQLAAGVDYVLYGQLDNVDLFNTGANSFHNQVYEYRKSLHANLEDGEDGPREPLPPLPPLGVGNAGDYNDNDDDDMDAKVDDAEPWAAEEESLLEPRDEEESLLEPRDEDEDNEDTEDFYMNSYDGDEEENKYNFNRQVFGSGSNAARRSTEDVMRREEESHAYDRKLTRLVEQYPSIWCTRHADYGNFDVTRKQWRTIASHFTRSENIKLRWKNIRKRYVRIERRMREGKRFNGYFDKATNFLSNRDFTQNNWRPIDRGEADGDVYERKHLDEVEQALHPNTNDDEVKNVRSEPYRRMPVNLVEIKPLDLKIINFVKCNPVLWRKSSDPICNKIDEQTRKSLWMHLWKSMPSLNCEDIVDRWTHLYEMYKTFRLKTIKDEGMLANLELKYSKYLAKLYFLYKIDEEDLRNEYVTLEDCFNIDDEHLPDTKLQDMPDDKEFLLQLVRTVRQYTPLWKKSRSIEYHDTVLRERLWGEIANKLKEFKHKQASDDEDNEIEIVEPHTDTITLDSDNDDEEPTRDTKPTLPTTTKAIKTTSVAVAPIIPAISSVASANPVNNIDDQTDFMSATQLFLASMLEVDLSEGDQPIAQSSPGGSDTAQKKQPRKKTTHKPNPTLLKQKELLERERLEEMKRSDAKLKMKCAIELKKAEDEYPFAKEMLDEKEAEKKLKREEKKKEISPTVKSTEEPIASVEVLLVDDLNSSVKEDVPKKASSNDANTEKKKVQDTVVIEVVVGQDCKEKEKPAIEGKDSKEQNVKENESKVEGESVEKALTGKKTEIVKEIRKEENLIPQKTEEDKKVAAEVDAKEKEFPKKDIDKLEDNNVTETATKDQHAEESVSGDVEMKELNTLGTEKSQETDTAQDEKVVDIIEPIEQIEKDEDMIEPIEQIEENIDEIQDTTIDETLNESLTAKEASVGKEETVEKMVKADGEEVDVDAEIEKLLQNSKNSTNEHKSEEIMLSTIDIVDLPSEKEIIAITADTNLNAEATSASPDLFNDINELIEKENNAMT